MAIFRKLLKNRAGDIIIPVVDVMGDYSTSEVNTGYTWVDGKPIYKKTVYIQSLPNSSSATYPHGVTNMGTVVKYEGYMYDSSLNGFAWALPMSPNPTGAAINNGLRLYISSGIVVDAGSDRRAYSAYVTIYYTKTS